MKKRGKKQNEREGRKKLGGPDKASEEKKRAE